jgi:hypothetical protein
MNPSAAASTVILATACLVAAGCSALTGSVRLAADDDRAVADAEARRRSLAPRTLPVEVRFVRHDPRDPAFAADLWHHVDEQALDSGLRLRLAATGLRAGVVTGSLPADIAARLEPAAAVDPATPEDAALRRVLRLLPGKRAEVVAATGLADLVLLERGTEGARGATYRDATALVAVQAWPDADGLVRIRLVPEVKHGAVQRSWVGEEGMFRLETGQARRAFDDLGVTARLPPGGTLVVGVAGTAGAGIGDALLRERSADGSVRLLLVRPLAAAPDPLFAADGADENDDQSER